MVHTVLHWSCSSTLLSLSLSLSQYVFSSCITYLRDARLAVPALLLEDGEDVVVLLARVELEEVLQLLVPMTRC